jgi:hypothetical protein
MRRFVARLSYANVVSTLALVLAAGGVSYAAVRLPAASVGTRQLKNHAVTPRKLAVPVGGAAITASHAVEVQSRSCDSVLCPGPTSVRVVRGSVRLNRSAAVLALISGEVDAPGAVGSELDVDLSWAGKKVDPPTREVDLTGQVTQIAVPIVARLSAGRHRLTVSVATNASAAPVTLRNANVTVLPIR